MIVDTIKTIAENSLNMTFAYGDRTALNLIDENTGKYALWLLPVENKPEVNGLNKVVVNNYDIALFMCIKSDMDAGTPAINGQDYYAQKWGQNIKPLYTDKAVENFVKAFTCKEEFTVSAPVVKEVINLFDLNVDGLYVTLTIKEDLI